ncbi:unnamed protein product [Alopecurus aequalis]
MGNMGDALLFRPLAVLGAVYVATLAFRVLAHLALLMQRTIGLRRRYGAWAVVTGPTSGIGRSMALELARLGLNVVLVGRDPAKLRAVSKTISAAHDVETKTVVLDLALVATPEGDAGMRRLKEAVAVLDVGVLVNNAGVASPHAVHLHEADAEAWVRMLRVNLWALTEVTAAVLPGMVARGRGAVVNIGSAAGCIEALPPFPLYAVYTACKGYVAQFSRSLYVEYRSKGIDVQCQAPMFVETKMTSDITARGSLLSQSMVLPDTYAGAAARWIGRGPLCIPNLGHRLQWYLCCVAPDCLIRACLSEDLRQRALFYRQEERRPTSPQIAGPHA